jgi:menaquinone-dependent protoporphyrinogen oxidase
MTFALNFGTRLVRQLPKSGEEISMNTNVLVAYATKYGATAEIAERIGQTLRQAGLQADIVAAEQAGDPANYAAVVLGSAVYAGSWRKEAAAYLEAHEAALTGRPTWLFSSGPTGEGDAVELMKGWRFPEALLPIADRIQPRDIASFHGDIDTKKLNLAEKVLIKGIKAPTGDFRNWDAIDAWAGGIAQARLS